jgi:hypothetical protein
MALISAAFANLAQTVVGASRGVELLPRLGLLACGAALEAFRRWMPWRPGTEYLLPRNRARLTVKVEAVRLRAVLVKLIGAFDLAAGLAEFFHGGNISYFQGKKRSFSKLVNAH